MFIEVKCYYHRSGEYDHHTKTMNALVNTNEIIHLVLGEDLNGKHFYILECVKVTIHLPLAEGRRLWKKLKSLK